MGFVGASPLHNVLADWVGALVGVGAVYVWTRWLGHATACSVTTGARRDEANVPGDHRITNEQVELDDDAFAVTPADGHRPT